MIVHVLKMFWNDWRAYVGIVTEQGVVFVILMLCVVSVSVAFKRYIDPGVLDTSHTVCFGYMVARMDEQTVETETVIRGVVENLEKLPYVEAISWSMGTIPYMRSDAWHDSVRVDGKVVRVNWKGSDMAAGKVLRPDIVEGEWLTGAGLADGSRGCVVSRQLVDELGWDRALGRRLVFKGITYTIVGVVSGMKHDALKASEPTLIVDMEDLKDNGYYRELCARVKPGKEKNFIIAYYKEANRLLPARGVEVFATEMGHAKKQKMSGVVINLYLQAIPTLFLLVFAFIGTFGLFLQHMGSREHEFAVRLSVGSTKRELWRLVIVESLVVTVVACTPGVILSFFIYDYTEVEVAGVAVTLVIMLIFSVLSAWLPACKVTKINPAVTLK